MPICLPPKNSGINYTGLDLTACGWGVTDNGRNSEVKLKVNVSHFIFRIIYNLIFLIKV